jgi:hypothetical protein
LANISLVPFFYLLINKTYVIKTLINIKKHNSIQLFVGLFKLNLLTIQVILNIIIKIKENNSRKNKSKGIVLKIYPEK